MVTRTAHYGRSSARHLLIIRHEPQHIIEQHAYEGEQARDDAATAAQAQYGAAAVTCGFAPTFSGRRVTRVWL